MVPQLVLLHIGDSLEAYSMHYMVLMFVSRSLGALFWFHGFGDVAPTAGGVNYAGWGIVVAHVLQLATLSYMILRWLHLKRKGLVERNSSKPMISLPEII